MVPSVFQRRPLTKWHKNLTLCWLDVKIEFIHFTFTFATKYTPMILQFLLWETTSMLTAFHYHSLLVLIWLKYCWKGHKIWSNPPIHSKGIHSEWKEFAPSKRILHLASWPLLGITANVKVFKLISLNVFPLATIVVPDLTLLLRALDSIQGPAVQDYWC